MAPTDPTAPAALATAPAASELTLNQSLRMRYLVALAKRGSADAYERLIKRYRGFVRLKASSYFLLGGDSEDLIQEGLVGLYKAIRDFRTDRESSFRNFAELCITRQIITAVKTASRNKHAPLNQYVSFAQSPAAVGRRRDDARGDPPGPDLRGAGAARDRQRGAAGAWSRACRACSPSSRAGSSRSISTATPTSRSASGSSATRRPSTTRSSASSARSPPTSPGREVLVVASRRPRRRGAVSALRPAPSAERCISLDSPSVSTTRERRARVHWASEYELPG